MIPIQMFSIKNETHITKTQTYKMKNKIITKTITHPIFIKDNEDIKSYEQKIKNKSKDDLKDEFKDWEILENNFNIISF
tara:strand:+ start:123 stop:359 length:237 start_codon:yes stop_codon:yes gene_type:complete